MMSYIRSRWGSVGTFIKAALFGYLFFAAVVLGSCLQEEQLSEQWGRMLFYPLMPGAILAFVYPYIYQWCERNFCGGEHNIKFQPEDRIWFWKRVLILLLAWMPVLLAYYPGLFAYDAHGQTRQIVSHEFSMKQPLVHTLLFAPFYLLGGAVGSYNLGMLLYTLFQMVLFAMAIAYMLLFLRRLQCARALQTGLLVFFSAMPVFSVLSISMTKDILFSAAVVSLFVTLCYGVIDPALVQRKGYTAMYLFSAVSMGLLRNNGIYVLIILLWGGVILRPKAGKKLALLAAAAIFLIIACDYGLKTLVRSAPINGNEALSIPCQQLACTYKDHLKDLTAEEKALVEKYVPNAAYYNPYIADATKGSCTAFQDIAGFGKFYIKMLCKYPVSYIKAFLLVTKGYWDLNDISHAEIYGKGLYARQGYLLTDTKGGFGIEHITHFAALETLYEKMFSDNEYQRIPLIRYLFSPALYMWLIILCIFYKHKAKGKAAAYPLVLLLGLILTILAGPCCLIRYALPYILCIPPLYAVTFYSAK